jgi:tRNA(fMet)-specific endonuclease VapC
MAFLIDSSVLIDIERQASGLSSLVERLGDESVGMAAITASELLHGVHRADSALRRARRERFVEAVLSAVAVYPFDLDVARVHARVWADLAAAGCRIGAHDLIIAATALTHELALATGNADEFRRVEGLQLIAGWTTP